MGLAYIEGFVRATGRRRRARRVRFLVDSGAVYSVLPRSEWHALGLKPDRDLEFVLADGTTLTRGVSACTFELEGRRANSPVVLGETEDEALLGAVTLETLGLILSPLNRTLQPMRMVLAWCSHGRREHAESRGWISPTRGSSVQPERDGAHPGRDVRP